MTFNICFTMLSHYQTAKIMSIVHNSNVFSTKNEKKSNNDIFSQFSAIFVEKSLFSPKMSLSSELNLNVYQVMLIPVYLNCFCGCTIAINLEI